MLTTGGGTTGVAFTENKIHKIPGTNVEKTTQKEHPCRTHDQAGVNY
jgi:hypothetical protein